MITNNKEANWIPFDLSASEKLAEMDKFIPIRPVGTDAHLVSISKIYTMVDVFQPRLDGLDQKHLRGLKGDLRRLDPKDIDPILVIAQQHPGIGLEYIVVDGHHRLETLKSLGRDHINIKVWQGSAREALEQGIKENNKAKLSLSSEDQYETAWKLVQHMKPCGTKPHYKREEIADIAGVSTRFVDEARAHWRQLKGTEGLDSTTWREARAALKQREREAQGDIEGSLDEAAQRLAKDIPPHVREQLQKYPDMAARIIKASSPRTVEKIPAALISIVDLSEAAREECLAQLGYGDDDDDLDGDY
jgi:hypothetical protein